MTENVETGGLMKFNYSKLDKQQASDRVKREIREAYEKAEIRKAEETKKMIIWWVVGIVLFILIIGLLIYFNN
ncbi:MAG: hypothetical protein AABW82_04910 [Nanoarchaeota archaeon]